VGDPARRRGIAPGSRKRQAKTAPSETETPFPITDYFVRSSDPLGRSVLASVTCPPDFRRIAATLVVKEFFTFQTEGDVFRWCIKHGLAELARRARDKEITTEAQTLAGWLRVAATEHEHLYYLSILRKVSQTVSELLRSGHPKKAEELAEKVWTTVDKVKDEHWREVYRKGMKQLLDRIRASTAPGAAEQR
jgi:hypothetical protein